MSSREAILSRIRAAQADSPPVDPPPVPEVWPQTGMDREQLAAKFTEALEAVHGEIVRCASIDDATNTFTELVQNEKWTSVGAIDDSLCREVSAGLKPETISWAAESPNPPEMGELSVGLVSAEHLLADTGSCMIRCGTAGERLMCYLPPVSVVVAKTDSLAENMPAIWPEVVLGAFDKDIRGEFVFVTGPSRTADIEKILILGVHGPKRVIVLLVG